MILPDGADGAKTGLDDYLAAGHTVADLTALATVPAAAAPELAGGHPWDGDAAGLLDDLPAFLRSYVAFPSGHAAVAVTLWAAHTHLVALLRLDAAAGAAVPGEAVRQVPGAGAAGTALRRGRDAVGRLSRLPVPAYRRRAGHASCWTRPTPSGSAARPTRRPRRCGRSSTPGTARSATVGRVEMNGQAAKLTRFSVTPRPRSPASATCRTRSWTGPSSCGCAAAPRTSGSATTGNG